jgi:hypothetical protein
MNRTISVAPVRKSVRVNAAPDRAFEVFTAGIARWWLKTHSVNAATTMKEAVMEPRAGGRWFERGVDGSESDWGRVLVWEPPGRVVLGWQLNDEFKFDPGVITEVEVRFIAESATVTRVELEHRNLERFAESAMLRVKIDGPTGWGALLASYAATAAS